MAIQNQNPDIDRPERGKQPLMNWASDAIAEMLRQLPIEYISLNPGASFRGLHDSIVNYLGNREPQFLLTLHEEHAVAMAHGYAKVTGKPMGVIVHSNVGLMHAAMGVYNAWCDRAPVIILGATGPVDAAKRRPWIDWIHTSRDQGALIRHYTKWDDQPASLPAALESILRAFQIACTPPTGPVYVCLDVALQEERLAGNLNFPDVSRFRPGLPQQASPETIEQAAETLLSAGNPVILAGRVSRRQEDWDHRVRLAELLGATVMSDIKVGASFPTGHPLHGPGPSHRLSGKEIRVIREADVILSLDWLDLAGAFKQVWGTDEVGSKVIHCSVDNYRHNGWSMDYLGLPPVDISIPAEPDRVVSSLLAAIKGRVAPKKAENQKGEIVPPANPNTASPARNSGPITYHGLALCLKEAVRDRIITFVRLPLGWPAETWPFSGPLDFLGYDGGGGLGAGPGMAIGAALALRDSGRLPVAITGDGDYSMGVNALWTAAHYRIPLLMIITNNRGYYTSGIFQGKVAEGRQRPAENRWIGTELDDPPLDIAGLARAQGLKGEGPIDDIMDLPDVLSRAVTGVENGDAWVVDVLIDQSNFTSPVARVD